MNMSQPEIDDSILNAYFDAVESFQRLLETSEYVIKYDHAGLLQLRESLNECYNKIYSILTLQDTNSPHLVALFQLKKNLQQLIDVIECKISQHSNNEIYSENNKENMSSTRNPKTDFNDKTDKKIADIIRDSKEQPRVNGLNEIGALSEVKKVLRTLIILPRSQPQLFLNRQMCNSVLLFGPPGTGKTKIVHALAAESKAVLHAVAVGDFLSPYVGQTEKALQSLFQHIGTSDKFTILFIDEIDGICKRRDASEQEYSRRIKTELMCQMSKIEQNKNMFVICATNCPWDLDTAILRRFQKRIYIPLPNPDERLELLQLLTKSMNIHFSSEYLPLIKMKTDGFSGSDLSDLIKHALNIPIMELEDTKIWKVCSDGFYEPVEPLESSGDELNGVLVSDLNELPPYSVRARSVQMRDFINAADNIMSSVPNQEVKKFEMFVGR